jgi:hypothetical protein
VPEQGVGICKVGVHLQVQEMGSMVRLLNYL